MRSLRIGLAAPRGTNARTITDRVVLPSVAASYDQDKLKGDDLVFGGLGGLIGGITYGLVLEFTTPATLHTAIPALYGIAGPAPDLGWVIHLGFSFAFGLIYAAVASLTPLSPYANRLLPGIVVGVVYGVAVWILAMVVLVPIWLSVMDAADLPSMPLMSAYTLLAHVTYGALLGLIYSASWP